MRRDLPYMTHSFDLVVQDELEIDPEVFDFVRYVPWPYIVEDFKSCKIGLGCYVDNSDYGEEYDEDECCNEGLCGEMRNMQ